MQLRRVNKNAVTLERDGEQQQHAAIGRRRRNLYVRWP